MGSIESVVYEFSAIKELDSEFFPCKDPTIKEKIMKYSKISNL